MIVGLSHIALSSDNVEQASETLAMLGYRKRFDEPELTNHSEKRRFLRHYAPKHHIRALAAPGAMAIELLDHGQLGTHQAADLIPIFSSDTPIEHWQAITLDQFPISQDGRGKLAASFPSPVLGFHDPTLNMKLLWSKQCGGGTGIVGLAWASKSIAATEEQLRLMRFRQQAGNASWSLLTPIPSLMANILPVEAVDCVGWEFGAHLDARGCACLAFMSRSTDTPRYLKAAAADELTTFGLTVNRAPIQVTMARVLNGPILELVEKQ